MAWPYTCSGALSQIKYHTQSAFMQADDAVTDMQAARTHWDRAQDHAAIWDICLAIGHLAEAIKYNTFSFAPFYPYGAVYYYLANCIEIPEVEEYELTAKKICEAWSLNSFEDRALTIAFIDRMRQLTWNEPFYIQWAAQPEL